jgi:formylglycine-generating enzyme required for sulfatase activity
MGQFPVTNGQYQRVAAVELPDSLKAPTFEAEDQPAAGLSWKMAHQWCEKASKQTGLKIRLPTEVEWERTARGKDERRYPWGQTELSRERALYWSSGPTGRIGERPLGASPWGAQELLGNVWEWCEDFSGVVPDKNLVDWVQRTPSAGWRAERVLRGGAWLTRESSVNACYCGHRPPESRDLCLGFRVVLTK